MEDMRAASTRTVTFADEDHSVGYGIRIEFRNGDGSIAHLEYMGDADYNSAIVDWILFGTYHPLEQREHWVDDVSSALEKAK